MSTEKILSAESVVDFRAREKMEKGEVKQYAEAMRVVLAEDQLLAECYRAGKPYLEASAARAYQDEMPNVTAKSQLGVLISGARLPSNAPDVPLMLRIANLTPGLVRAAADERIDEMANAITGRPGMPQQKSEAYPIALRQIRQEHPELVAASESGVLGEAALREIYYPWFSRD